jgi:hypothetical protein
VPDLAQLAAVAEAGLVLVPVTPDIGDCLMEALIMAAPWVFPPGTTTGQVRDSLVASAAHIIDNRHHAWYDGVDHTIR